jgi:voltage-gated potassium channel
MWLVLLELRAPLITLILAYAVSCFGLVLIPGETDTGEVYHLSFLQAFYILSYTATTIGFGEIPYAFTDTQRLWMLVVIYSTVIAWLYAIGSVLTVFTDPEFRKLRRHQKTVSRVRSNRSPFWIVCGYGGAGSQLVRFLDTTSMRCVVLDAEKARVDSGRLSSLSYELDVLLGDATDPNMLVDAGVQHPLCQGVAVLTDSDQVNLTVATNAKILAPRVPVFARSASDSNTRNLRSFDTDVVVDVERTAARAIGQLIRRPQAYALYHELVDPDLNRIESLVIPDGGHWIVCASGRFAELVIDVLRREEIAFVLVNTHQPDPASNIDWVEGLGTEASTLRKARISEASGIIAATTHDGDNLSILLTAKTEKSHLVTVARRNRPASEPVFRHGGFSVVLREGRMLAQEMFARIQSPLLHQFLVQLDLMPEALVSGLIERLNRRLPHLDVELDHHVVELTESGAPAVVGMLDGKIAPRVGDLLVDPGVGHDNLPAICLLLVRFNGDLVPFPGENLHLSYGDALLIWGEQGMKSRMDWLLGRHDVFLDVIEARSARAV